MGTSTTLAAETVAKPGWIGGGVSYHKRPVNPADPRVPRRAAPRSKIRHTNRTRDPFALMIVLAVAVVISMGAVIPSWPRPSTAPGSSVIANGVSREDMRVIPNIRNWAVAKPSDLRVDFTDFLHQLRVEPLSKIELDANGSGELSGSAYLLMTHKSPDLKRVVWVVNHQVVYDLVDRVQGIAKVPSRAMSHITWSEGGAPTETVAGDGLMLIRDYTSPNGVTIFFVKNGKMYSGVPVNLANIDFR